VKVSDFNENWKVFEEKTFILKTGPFSTAIRVKQADFYRSFLVLYQHHEILFEEDFADYHIRLTRPKNFHFFYKPQIQFLLDGYSVFNPLPLNQAFPVFEWGLNWCIGNRCNFFLVIHAGVLEKQGQGVLLPGTPGSGKSTLCAALMLQGWRLLSDELALIDLQTGDCRPLSRPISLKDQSIELIRGFSKAAVLSETVRDTQKGSVAYLKPTLESVQKIRNPVRLKKIVFPKFQSKTENYGLTPISRARAFMQVADQSFNYHILGSTGFNLLKKVLESCECFEFCYNGDLGEAEIIFNSLFDEH